MEEQNFEPVRFYHCDHCDNIYEDPIEIDEENDLYICPFCFKQHNGENVEIKYIAM